VYCPRCGTPNESADRFCSACGTALKEVSSPAEKRSLGQRIVLLVGDTRKARWITAATVGAIAVAIAAFITLKPSDDGIPRDAYTIEADQICLSAKRQIVAAERSGRASTFAAALVPIVGSWRSQVSEMIVPVDRIEQAQQLEIALRDVEIQIAQLARIAHQGNERRTLASAKQADAATSRVEDAVVSLGLSQCAAATIGVAPESS
jgi:hypothetical protein